jgi:DHA1 family bicyclomycin/chloramphenicol resistance-like MFS transporter
MERLESMSTRECSSIQENHQEATLPSTFSESGQGVTESREAAPRIRARHVLILGALTAFGPLSTDMYLPSLPSVSHDLHAAMSLTQITLTACILGLSIGQVITGPISDRYGRRRPLLIGIALFALISLLCMVAPSVAVLTILRFIQGIAGATGLVLALAIARDLYSGITLARCISLLMTVNFLAPIIAPVLGGQLLRFTSWRGVFVTLALISVVFFLASAFGLDETLEASRRQRGGIATTLRAIRDLLADRRFVGYALSSGFAFTAAIVYISVSPFILENLYGLSPQLFSLVFGVNALGLAGMSQISAKLVNRASPRKLLLWGTVAIAVAAAALLVMVLSGIGLVGVLPALFVITASLGLIAPNATALALADTSSQTAGSASALLGMLQFSIGAIVAPLVGLGGNDTAVPMAAVMAAFSIAAFVVYLVLCRPARIYGQAE